MKTLSASRRGRGSKRMRAALAGMAALAATALVAPGAAQAGTYPMYACDVPGIRLPSPTYGAWNVLNTSRQVQIAQTCATDPHGSWTFAINYPTGVLAQNTEVGIQLDIPATGPTSSISIARVADWSATALTAQGANQPRALGDHLAADIAVPPGGDATGFDGTGTSGLGHDTGLLPSGTKHWHIGVFCEFVGAQRGNCTLPTPFLRIRGIKTTLQEGIQPTATIEGGSLTFAGARKGAETVSYTGTDAESGVEKVEVTLDGAVVATESLARDLTLPVNQQVGACTYDALRACPASHSGLLTVDTTRVPDGAYELAVRTTDAAGNSRTTVAAQPVVIDNVPDQPTPAGPTPTGVPGAPGAGGPPGPAGRDGAVLTLNGLNASAAASLRATFSATASRTIRSKYGKKVLITGQLLSPAGRPVVGARVSVLQQDKTFGAKLVPAGEVITDASGRFRYVTTAVRSRTIRFAYRAHLEDRDFASTIDVSLGVIARLTLSASPRSLRNGHVVTFRGSVASAPANVRKVIELQVKKGSRWMTFRTTRLRNGRFTERYRFTRTRGRVTYTFRARVREEVGFPFLTSHSRAVKVTVRG